MHLQALLAPALGEEAVWVPSTTSGAPECAVNSSGGTYTYQIVDVPNETRLNSGVSEKKLPILLSLTAIYASQSSDRKFMNETSVCFCVSLYRGTEP